MFPPYFLKVGEGSTLTAAAPFGPAHHCGSTCALGLPDPHGNQSVYLLGAPPRSARRLVFPAMAVRALAGFAAVNSVRPHHTSRYSFMHGVPRDIWFVGTIKALGFSARKETRFGGIYSSSTPFIRSIAD